MSYGRYGSSSFAAEESGEEEKGSSLALSVVWSGEGEEARLVCVKEVLPDPLPALRTRTWRRPRPRRTPAKRRACVVAVLVEGVSASVSTSERTPPLLGLIVVLEEEEEEEDDDDDEHPGTTNSRMLLWRMAV